MNPQIKKAFKNPFYACELVLNQMARYISDENFVKWKYYLIFRKRLNLDNPQTYNEKLQWLKLNCQHKEYTQMVDKYEAKKIASNLIGEDYIIPTIGIYDSFDDIDFNKLPNQFVLKCTHNSGGVVICKNKSVFNVDKARQFINKCLRKNPYWATREYPYKDVKPRIIVEQFLSDGRTEKEGLTDFKFFCFNGKAKFLYVSQGLEDHQTAGISFFDLDGMRLPFKRLDFRPIDRFVPPHRFDEMKLLADSVAKRLDCPFIRIDLYEVQDKIFFSEFTFFPCSGMIPFDPLEWDAKIGELIHLPISNQC